MAFIVFTWKGKEGGVQGRGMWLLDHGDVFAE